MCAYDDGCVAVVYVRYFRVCVSRRCVPGGRRKTGNVAHRIDSHALPRRSEYWSRRPPAHVVYATLQRLTTKNLSSKKKTTCIRYIHTSTYTDYHSGDHGSRGWLHIKEEPFGCDDDDEFLVIYFLLPSPQESKSCSVYFSTIIICVSSARPGRNDHGFDVFITWQNYLTLWELRGPYFVS